MRSSSVSGSRGLVGCISLCDWQGQLEPNVPHSGFSVLSGNLCKIEPLGAVSGGGPESALVPFGIVIISCVWGKKSSQDEKVSKMEGVEALVGRINSSQDKYQPKIPSNLQRRDQSPPSESLWIL